MDSWIEEQILAFQKEFGERLDTLETMYHVHGGESWKGRVIPAFLRLKLKEAYEKGYQKGVSDGIDEANIR